MAQDIYDLVVRHHNRKVEMAKSGAHPTEQNSFTFGLVSGLNLGIYLLQSGKNHDSDMEDILADSIRPLKEVLASANAHISADLLITWEMYHEPDYRRTAAYPCYEKGVRLGFSYVFDVFKAYADDSVQRSTIVRTAVGHVKMQKIVILAL